MEMLQAFLVAMATSVVVVGCSCGPRFPRTWNDGVTGPQKVHGGAVPRIGGVGIVVGVFAGLWWASRDDSLSPNAILLCAMPAFAIGFVEDVTRHVSARRRLLVTLATAALAAWLLGATIRRTDLPVLDWLVAHPAGALLLTTVALAGVANAVNIIDGLNGLASMCAVFVLLGEAWIAYTLGDAPLLACSLTAAGATLGFFVWNYPRGHVFLGDGGAYFLGFLAALLGVLLVARHPSLSPLFPLLLMAYPVFETVFTIYRRVLVQGRSWGVADALHLHSLLYRRVLRAGGRHAELRQRNRRNAMTAPYLWALCLPTVVAACILWQDTATLALCFVLFGIVYVWLYRRIVRFRTPRWLAPKRPSTMPARGTAPG